MWGKVTALFPSPKSIVLVFLRIIGIVFLYNVFVALFYFLGRNPVYWMTFGKHVERIRKQYLGQRAQLAHDLRVLEECGTHLGRTYGAVVTEKGDS
ncbi:MAG: hypothetical protein HY567_03130 [Candidatus Kerfeldbacteria bacterium]|nr:hypothetical protein [Candidatus Kerfeldbacteria bacterium]